MFIRAYLRASTAEQDAERARQDLERFAQERGKRIAAFYVENESGAKLDRPELLRLISDAQKGDILLVEQVDRLARLKMDDWEKLKGMLSEKGLIIVSPELPLTWSAMSAQSDVDDMTKTLYKGLSNMVLDMLAVIARKDYDDRRRRQAQGIAKAKARGLYAGRERDESKRSAVAKLLKSGSSYSEIQKVIGCSRWLVASVAKELRN